MMRRGFSGNAAQVDATGKKGMKAMKDMKLAQAKLRKAPLRLNRVDMREWVCSESLLVLLIICLSPDSALKALQV
jgi:hypothetical protein